MSRRAAPILIPLIFAATAAAAAELPKDARLGVVDALAPRLSAGFGTAANAAKAPTIRDDWRLGAVAQEQAVTRLSGLGYRASAAELPSSLVDTVRRGGALDVSGLEVRLNAAFSKSLGRWMQEQKLDGVVVLRTLSRPLAQGTPVQSGYGIARGADGSVAYANVAPLLVTGAVTPKIDGAPQCLVTAPLDAAQVAGPRKLADLAPLAPVLKDVLRKSVDGALVRSGVMQGEAACE